MRGLFRPKQKSRKSKQENQLLDSSIAAHLSRDIVFSYLEFFFKRKQNLRLGSRNFRLDSQNIACCSAIIYKVRRLQATQNTSRQATG